ncbi:YugN-like family protein [Rossellomorea vietnamensis]|uniref:YugN-like family protein n=1 Tax=Rossellomorea vietnamensis TaxID=218284 RepID=A0ACD4CD69_9BACI|nr:YugN-like family protein [Rossellomorea vietnamensis]UXH45537.1 YugN-like family protein [Rossellomorea vietnamensis]WQI96899.1 YugN-like family protein [Rossellomorea vietnamensis]
MRFEATEFESLKVDLNRLDEIMESHGLVRAGQWDYERVTYDRKFEIREGIFYLRIQGLAVEGDIGKHDAVIQLMTPLLGKHYYPHGVEYGEGEEFPKHLVTSCEKLLADVKKDAMNFAW